MGSTVAVNALTLEGGSVLPTVVLVAVAAVADSCSAPFRANTLNSYTLPACTSGISKSKPCTVTL